MWVRGGASDVFGGYSGSACGQQLSCLSLLGGQQAQAGPGGELTVNTDTQRCQETQ